jgi:chromosome segregation ATPase
MFDIHIPASLEYDTANANLVVTELKKLHSLAGVPEWKEKARAEVQALHSILKPIEEKQAKVAQMLQQDQQEHAAKPFFAKLIDLRKEQKHWLAEQARLDREKAHIEALIERFESAIAFMPESAEDLQALIKESKQQKEELLSEKKAVSRKISSIRVEARQQTANTNYGNTGKGDRRRIRMNKESALQPQEGQKAAIERQVRELDQSINWLEKFEI